MESLGRFLGVDAALGTRTVVEDGRITRRVDPPLCFGEGKCKLVEQHLAQRGISLEHTTFYSDSEVDLPLLEAVGKPVVVNPSPLLRLTARSRRWEEQHWRPERAPRMH